MRELALLLDNGDVVYDSSWQCVADVMGSFHAFGVTRAYGVVVDAATLAVVYPPQPIDGAGTNRTSPLLG